VYNEEKRIAKTIKALLEGVSFDGLKLEKVIFVDDGSKDKTKLKIKEQKSKIERKLKAKIRIISYTKNRGKGYAIKKGMLASKSDYTLMFDADMSTGIKEFKKFLPYIKENVPVIIGTRKNGESIVVKHQPLYRELLGRGFTLLSNIILDTWVTDFTCGFKAFSKIAKDRIFTNTIVDRWSYDAEILYLARKMNFKIQEISVIWNNDERTKVNLIKDLPETLADLIKIRLHDYNLLISFAKKPAIL